MPSLRSDGIDDGSLPLIGHRGAGDAIAARNVGKTVGPEADFAHAVEAADRQIRIPKLALGPGEPAADRRQHAGIVAGGHVGDERRPARLSRRVVEVELRRAAPGPRERNEKEKGHKAEDRSLQRRCSPCEQTLGARRSAAATMPPGARQIKPEPRSAATRPGPAANRGRTLDRVPLLAPQERRRLISPISCATRSAPPAPSSGR